MPHHSGSSLGGGSLSSRFRLRRPREGELAPGTLRIVPDALLAAFEGFIHRRAFIQKTGSGSSRFDLLKQHSEGGGDGVASMSILARSPPLLSARLSSDRR